MQGTSPGSRSGGMGLATTARGARRLLPAATMAVAAALALRTLDDFDTWWHLAAGRWIAVHAAVPTTDTLSYTVPDHPWINLQWLYDLALYGLYRLGAEPALTVSAAIAFTAAVWVTLANVRAWTGPVSAWALMLCMVFVVEERFAIRPEMVTFVLLALLLRILMRARLELGRRLWLLAPLMLLWVNSHSLFVIGLFAIACTIAGALVAELPLLPDAWRRASRWPPALRRKLLVHGLAAGAVTLANPYFAEGVAFPIQLISRIDGSSTVFRAIGEFRRPFSGYFTTFSITAYQAFFFLGFALLGLAGLTSLVARRRPGADAAGALPGFDLGLAYLFVGLAYLSTLARRNIGIFAFAAAPVLAVWCGTLAAVLAGKTRERLVRAGDLVAIAAVPACVALVGSIVTNEFYRWNTVTHEFSTGVFTSNFPIHAAAFAREAELPPKLYNDLTAGGYLTWDAPVPGGVFIDGRLEVYDTEFFSEYLSALSNPQAWRAQADRYGIHTALLFHRWSNRHPLIRALASDPGWSLVYHDDVAVILVRTRGNAAAIERARELAPAWHERTMARLATPTSRWRFPVDRVSSLVSYGALLTLIGAHEEAARVYEQALAFDLRPEDEILVRTRLGMYLAQRGQRAGARVHLERAAKLDPANRRLQQFLAELGA